MESFLKSLLNNLLFRDIFGKIIPGLLFLYLFVLTFGWVPIEKFIKNEQTLLVINKIEHLEEQKKLINLVNQINTNLNNTNIISKFNLLNEIFSKNIWLIISLSWAIGLSFDGLSLYLIKLFSTNKEINLTHPCNNEGLNCKFSQDSQNADHSKQCLLGKDRITNQYEIYYEFLCLNPQNPISEELTRKYTIGHGSLNYLICLLLGSLLINLPKNFSNNPILLNLLSTFFILFFSVGFCLLYKNFKERQEIIMKKFYRCQYKEDKF